MLSSLDGQLSGVCLLHVVVKDPKLSPIVVITATRGTGSSSVLKVKRRCKTRRTQITKAVRIEFGQRQAAFPAVFSNAVCENLTC